MENFIIKKKIIIGKMQIGNIQNKITIDYIEAIKFNLL